MDCRGPWVRDSLVQIWLELFREGYWLVLGVLGIPGTTIPCEHWFSEVRVAMSLRTLQFGGGRRCSGGRSRQSAELLFISWFWQQYFFRNKN